MLGLTTLRRGYSHACSTPILQLPGYVSLPLLIAAVFSTGGSLYAQEYNYRFQLEGIQDPASAKMITDVLRPVFNHPETPFAVFPRFNDETDTFVFRSDIVVTREQLDAALEGNGTSTTAFSAAAADLSGNSQKEER